MAFSVVPFLLHSLAASNKAAVMSRSWFLVLFFLAALVVSSATAFVGSNSRGVVNTLSSRRTAMSKTPPTSTTQVNMLPDPSFLSSTNNILISTIDSDIANIPQNEFAPVFMGGIVVMFGGVLSALIVGFILERGNLYANVVADSYVQSAQDEEFWKGLSDEEKKKAQQMIDRLNAKKAEEEGTAFPIVQSASESNEVVVTEVVDSEGDKTVELDMFSDYADTSAKK